MPSAPRANPTFRTSRPTNDSDWTICPSAGLISERTEPVKTRIPRVASLISRPKLCRPSRASLRVLMTTSTVLLVLANGLVLVLFDADVQQFRWPSGAILVLRIRDGILDHEAVIQHRLADRGLPEHRRSCAATLGEDPNLQPDIRRDLADKGHMRIGHSRLCRDGGREEFIGQGPECLAIVTCRLANRPLDGAIAIDIYICEPAHGVAIGQRRFKCSIIEAMDHLKGELWRDTDAR